jgi:lipid-binding SYLF domain-containing protein
MKLFLSTMLTLLLASSIYATAGDMSGDMYGRIRKAIQIVEKREGSIDPIPAEIFQNAKGVAICTIGKGGAGIGGQLGDGIVVIRHYGPNGTVWRAPSAFHIYGASLGLQLGYSSISYIIVLNSDHAIGQFLGQGHFKWDATATGTAGSDTGVESQSTRNLEKQEVLVYRESGGLYGGATFGGSTIETQDPINQNAYGENVHVRDILEGNVQPPAQAQKLYDLLDGKRE